MSFVTAAHSDGNASVKEGLYESAMLLIIGADNDGNVCVRKSLC